MPLSRRPAVGLAFLAFEQLLQPFLEFLQEIASSQIPAPAQFSPPLLQVLAALFAGQLQHPAFQVSLVTFAVLLAQTQTAQHARAAQPRRAFPIALEINRIAAPAIRFQRLLADTN